MPPSSPSSIVSTKMSPSTLSSPAHGQYDVQELTPRSKVKAMLAAIDAESDQETSPKSPTNKQTRRALAPLNGNRQNVERRPTKSAETAQSERDEDSEEDVFLPRSRVASRLNCQESEGPNLALDHNDSGSENAYTRIKRKLLESRKGLQGTIADGGERDKEATEPSTQESSPSRRSRRSSLHSLHTLEERSPEGEDSPAVSATAVQSDGENDGPPQNSRLTVVFRNLLQRREQNGRLRKPKKKERGFRKLQSNLNLKRASHKMFLRTTRCQATNWQKST